MVSPPLTTSNHSSKRRIFIPVYFDLPSATVTAILLGYVKIPLVETTL
jgi:hypothetical protein